MKFSFLTFILITLQRIRADVESTDNNLENQKRRCGFNTEFDQVRRQCVQAGFAYVPIPKCKDLSNANCFCKHYGYAKRGPKLGAHPSCGKYVSCFQNSTTGALEAKILACKPGFAYDDVAQVCFFKESVDCTRRDSSNLGSVMPSKCLSELTPKDPICGCDNYVWNSATLVPMNCYSSSDADFKCTKNHVVKNMLEIGVGDGIRPGRAPSDFTETAQNTGPGYLDAPWLKSVENPDGEYPYQFPLNKTALIMIDFQRDFVCPGGFGETLGNVVEKLQVSLQPARNILKAARALGLPIIHTLESHKSDLSDLKDNKYNRGNLPPFLRIGENWNLGRILVRGSCGNNIVDMVAPEPGEYIIYKPGKTAFYMTHLDDLLQHLGVTHIMVAGVTTEVCMQSTVREATDRGYEPLIVTDATASYFQRYRQQTIEQLVAQGALVAWAANSTVVLKTLEKACHA